MSNMRTLFTVVASITLAAGIAFSTTACSGGHNGNHNQKTVKHSKVESAISRFKQKAPQTRQYFRDAYGYAVLPSVGKGALVIGGAHGGGEVYKQGQLVGHTTMTKFNIGPQAGGKTFSEVIFFQNAQSFNHFTQGNFQFSANATAAGATAGAAANNNYSNGVMVFTMTKAALMAGVNIGGQKFSYTPLSQTEGGGMNNNENNGMNNRNGAAGGVNEPRTSARATGVGMAGSPGANGGQYNRNQNQNAGQANHSSGGEQNRETHRAVEKVIAKYKAKRPETKHYFDNAYGYAVFPSVGKGGLVIGGAYGGGEVYKDGEFVGNATITKFNIGAQAGGQTFSELVFFQNQQAFDHFTGGNFQFAADASAVGVKSGGSATNNYSHGVAIFTMTKAGLMAGANIGGQKFSFTPASQTSPAAMSAGAGY